MNSTDLARKRLRGSIACAIGPSKVGRGLGVTSYSVATLVNIMAETNADGKETNSGLCKHTHTHTYDHGGDCMGVTFIPTSSKYAHTVEYSSITEVFTRL